MKKQIFPHRFAALPPYMLNLLGFFILFAAFFLIELFAFLLLKPATAIGLGFGALWAGMLAGTILFLPRKAGRIVFAILYYVFLLWTLAQAGYYQVFDKMMWLSTVAYAGEGAAFLGDVLANFPFLWWLGMLLMIFLGIFLLRNFPSVPTKFLFRIPFLLTGVIFLSALCLLPQSIIRQHDSELDVPNLSASYATAYDTMYDAKRVYDFTGIYQLTLRDIWVNELYPLTSHYDAELIQQKRKVTGYFAQRQASTTNSMSGTFAGKNVILVLMESLDDWMITQKETPTIKKMMDEGIHFTNFYTPGYGSARTLNSEFCMNTGIYLPTTGSYVYDYTSNSFAQSIASQLADKGYTGHVFHYNNPNFYSREILEPAMGYESYVSYSDYVDDKELLCQDTLLFDLPEVSDLFFREGPRLNTIITRSAHLGYTFREIIASYAIKKHPEYRHLYGSEEENCARLKAKLIDDMFVRLLQELKDRGELENTVIIAMTDHYTYGYENMDELYAHSGVDSTLLLEKTPFFIWSADGPAIEVTKTLNTSDFLPTVLNLLGIDSPYSYLGQDAFDPAYQGYALFPDGSWICDGVAWQDGKILMNEQNRTVSQEEVDAMAALSEEYRAINNLLLTCDYYR